MTLINDTMICSMPLAYACPINHRPLHPEGDALLGGAQSYAVINGIPQFLRFPEDQESESAHVLVKLLADANASGWHSALETAYGAQSEMFRYVTDPDRARFIDSIPFPPESITLEIGPGLGQFTPVLAKKSKWVCAMEVDPTQAQFAALRCAQQGVINVSFACGGDDCRLPYPENAFDVIILNLVFEWCGSHNFSDPAEVCQRRLLDEFKRILKPGGILWLSTKNRYALRALLGKRDEHAYFMRFGNALPRPIMNLMLRVRGKKRPRGRLYSHNALQRMLRQAGLEPVKSFWAAPEMRYPSHCVETEAGLIRQVRKDPTLVQGETRLTRALMPLIPAGLVKHFTPGLAFLARKPR
jgi:SAM-dependent methyltransferase